MGPDTGHRLTAILIVFRYRTETKYSLHGVQKQDKDSTLFSLGKARGQGLIKFSWGPDTDQRLKIVLMGFRYRTETN